MSENGQGTATATETPAAAPSKPPAVGGSGKGKTKPNRKGASGGAKSKGLSAKSESKRKMIVRPYPQRTVEDALTIALNIKRINHGNPMPTDEVARSCNLSAKSTVFFYLAASSRDYGLTIGSRDTDKIELAPLGRDIVFAGDLESERENKRKAFFSIDIFKRVFDFYGKGKLPAERDYVGNTLQREFKLPPELHTEFIQLFEANCTYLGISEGVKGAPPPADRPADESGDIRLLGEPKGKFDRTAFVIMPFSEKGDKPRPSGFFGEVLKTLITPAGNAAGFAVETAEQKGSDIIQSTIINRLLEADLVIADLSDHNPNVLFELGIRIAKELPVVLIRAEGTGPIFDVDNMMRVFPYAPNLWHSTIERDRPLLADFIKAAWDSRSTRRNYMQILTGGTTAAPAKTAPAGATASAAAAA